jgi:hypothetical protein
VRPEGLGKLKQNHLIWYRTRDLPVCRIVPYPLHCCYFILFIFIYYLNFAPETLGYEAEGKLHLGVREQK